MKLTIYKNTGNQAYTYGTALAVVAAESEQQAHDLISFERCRNYRHPNEKPIDLLRYLIRTYTDEGDLVLDNTCGSGSTCVAALLEHRAFIGIEKEQKYFDIAVKRIEETKREMATNLFEL